MAWRQRCVRTHAIYMLVNGGITHQKQQMSSLHYLSVNVLPSSITSFWIFSTAVVVILQIADQHQTDLMLIRLRNDLYCVAWGIKLYSLTHLMLTIQRVGQLLLPASGQFQQQSISFPQRTAAASILHASLRRWQPALRRSRRNA